MLQFEILDLTKMYSVGDERITAVDNVSLRIEKGEFLSIVGHSGSGKTTLISLIGGILRPSSGKLLFKGNDICSFNDDLLSEYRNNKIGFMFQFASLIPSLTSKENVLLPFIFSSQKGINNRRRAEEYLDLVGISEKTNSYPSQLSGGQQRRVAIARALVKEPEIILADEPTGDLDEETEADIMNLFRKINEERKVTIILITHNLYLAKQADRQLKMSNGAILEMEFAYERDS